MSIPVSDVIISLGLISVVFAIHLAFTIDDPPTMTDEGYLWYGVLEVSRGQVPVRDFRSYEPGRYWISLLVLKFGRGLPWIRLAASATLAFGTLALVLALRVAGQRWSVSVATVLIVIAWSPHPHKRYEQATFLLMAGAITWLLADPSVSKLVVVGLVAGLVIVIGTNLGLYACSAALLSLLIVARGPELSLVRDSWWLFSGVLVGSSPLWVMFLTVRGFARAVLQRRVIDVVNRRSTNLPLPIPVPWRRTPSQISGELGTLGSLVTRGLFLMIPIAAFAACALALVGPHRWVVEQPVAIAAAVVTLPAWHHVVSRADVNHLTHVMAVPIVGLLAAISGDPWVLFIGFGIAASGTGLVGIPMHARVQRWRDPDGFVKRSVLGHRAFWFRSREAQLVEAALEARASCHPLDHMLAVPMTLWLLPLLEVRSAVFDSFCVFPATEAMEHDMIAEIEQSKPPVAVVGLEELDGRPDLRFDRTHPLVWAHLGCHYEPIELQSPLPPGVAVLRRC